MDYVLAIIISFVYFFYRFLEMRFISKETLPLKVIIGDSIKVFACTVIGIFIAEQFNMTKDALQSINNTQPLAFVDKPDF